MPSFWSRRIAMWVIHTTLATCIPRLVADDEAQRGVTVDLACLQPSWAGGVWLAQLTGAPAA